jgi:hypothetical protein
MLKMWDRVEVHQAPWEIRDKKKGDRVRRDSAWCARSKVTMISGLQTIRVTLSVAKEIQI